MCVCVCFKTWKRDHTKTDLSDVSSLTTTTTSHLVLCLSSPAPLKSNSESPCNRSWTWSVVVARLVAYSVIYNGGSIQDLAWVTWRHAVNSNTQHSYNLRDRSHNYSLTKTHTLTTVISSLDCCINTLIHLYRISRRLYC